MSPRPLGRPPVWADLQAFVLGLLARRWVRFGLVGGAATLSYILLGLLLVSHWGLPMHLGNVLAYALSFIVSYLGQSLWTFEARHCHRSMLPRFAATQAVGLGLNSAILELLTRLGLSYELAMPAAALLVPVFVYLLCKFWVFRQGPKPAAAHAPATAPLPTPAPGPAPETGRGSAMNKPLVSVIMNCLNSSHDLRAALDSLLAQTMTDYEVIFWDNGSTDESPAIAREYTQKSGGRLRYCRGEKTVPLGAARNLALAEAHGTYLAFLDCDDVWRPGKLMAQVALFEANARVGLVCTDTEIFDGKKTLKRLFAEARPERGMVFAALMERQWISMSSAMIRRTALESLLTPAKGGGEGERPTQPHNPPAWFDESLNVCEEADVFYRIAHDWELDFVDAPLTLWRVHGANTTFRKFGQFADETLRILDKHRRLYPGYATEHAPLVDLLQRRAAFQKAVALWREGKNAQARQCLAPWRHFSRKHELFWLASYLPGALFDVAAGLYFALPASLRR